jgi:hypothetical protein
MLSAINQNGCPQSIRIPVRNRWNPHRNNEKLQIGTSEVRLAIPDPSVQNEQNKSGEVSCGDSKALRA